MPEDELCDICRISLAIGDKRDFDSVPIQGPGTYEVTWRRYVYLILSPSHIHLFRSIQDFTERKAGS
jgi:hypothetical protein